MPDNLKLVNYFVKNFYFLGEQDVSFIASPRFKLIIDEGRIKNFKDFEALKNKWITNSVLEFSDFFSEDNCLFCAKFDVNAGKADHETGLIKLIVEDGLLASVHLNYEHTEEASIEMSQFLSASSNEAIFL